MALRDAGGQGDRDPGLDAVHSHPLQVGDNCDAIKRTSRGLDRVDDRIYCRTKPRLQLETDPYSRANYKTQFSVNQHFQASEVLTFNVSTLTATKSRVNPAF